MGRILALEYRPKVFDDVCEQGAVVDILRNQIESGDIKNGYLFVGSSGCGKTTSARIFANEINKGFGNPIELDAASNNGIDDVRRIIDQAKIKSLECQYKVFIIDECHSLSLSAWNALLKILEEPPKHVVFILCTTEPKKVIPTILSRVQRFDFRRISFNGIYNRLKYIIDNENKLGENIQYSEESIQFIAKMAEGGMRLAISMLDKCLGYSHNLDINIVTKALGSMKYDDLFTLLNSILLGDKVNILKIVEKAFLDGLDMKQYISDYANFLLDVNIYCLTKDINKIKIPNLYIDELNKIDSNPNKDLDKLLFNTTQLVNVVKYDDRPKFLILTGLLAQAERLV